MGNKVLCLPYGPGGSVRKYEKHAYYRSQLIASSPNDNTINPAGRFVENVGIDPY